MVRNGRGLSKIAGSLAHNTYRIGDEGGNVMFQWLALNNNILNLIEVFAVILDYSFIVSKTSFNWFEISMIYVPKDF